MTKKLKGLDINELAARQKTGQMLLCRGPQNQNDYEFMMGLVKDRSLGGIHISARFIRKGNPNLESEYVLIQKVQEAADYPILICEDLETSYLDNTFMSVLRLPDQLALGSANEERLCYEYGRISAVHAKSKGYNVVFGPIVDIAMNPESSCVGLRSFGSDKEHVARMAAEAIRGYQDQGMVVAAKHYPGFGESSIDSHMGMVYLNGDEKLLRERELYPYTYAMNHANLSGVMTGHIMVPNVDAQYPASLSRKLISLLRNTGYDGLIMTDSLAMVGVRNMFSLEECMRLAMQAGNDLIMADYRTTVEEAYNTMQKLWDDGAISESQLNAAVQHVIDAQNKTMKQPHQGSVGKRDMDIIDAMSAGAISATLSGVDSPAIDANARHLFLLQEGVYYKDPQSGRVVQEAYLLKTAETILREKFRNSDFLYIPEFPLREQIEHTMAATINYHSVVMVLHPKNFAYTGSSDATKRMVAVLSGLREKISAVLLFGNPYAAREFGNIPRIIFGYQGDNCQKYAALTLAGEHKATGKLPVAF